MPRHRELLLMAVLTLAVLGIYGQTYTFGFMNLDDNAYVSENPVVLKGLTPGGIRWAFTTGQEGNWSPLTWVSLMLDVELFGVNPGAQHLVNVALHLANTLLLFAVLCRMTRAVWPSWIVAALFGLHPLHVESVAWISERKDVLSTFFWFLTLGAYTFYVESRSRRWYAVMTCLFAAGLMAKSMLVTVPFLLLLLDVWPLRRISFDGAESRVSSSTAGRQRRSSDRRQRSLPSNIYPLLVEKVPLITLTVIFSGIAYATQQHDQAMVTWERLPLDVRITNALVSYVRYLMKAIWPVNLAIFYPYDRSLPAWQPIGAALFIASVSVLAVRNVRRHPYALVGWFWYLGTLVPVIGIVQIGGQALADRYTYVPLVGIFIAVAWLGQALVSRWALPRLAVGVGVTAVIGAYATVALAQIGLWSSSEKLFRHAQAVTSANAVVHNNLGVTLAAQGELDAAIEEFRAALRVAPHYADAYNNLGAILGRQGHVEEAVAQYRMALRHKPNSLDTRRNLALNLLKLEHTDEAIAQFRKALRIEPEDADLHYRLGIALIQAGQADSALAPLREAVRLQPDYAQAYNDLGVALMQLGRRDDAVANFEHALRLKPDLSDALYNLELVREGASAKGDAEGAD